MTPPAELLSLLEALNEPRILVDSEYRIMAANQAYRREFGNPRAIIGRTCYEVSHHFKKPCDQCGESCPRQAAEKSREVSRVLHLHHTPRGEEYVDVELIPIQGADGKIAYFVETMNFLREIGSQSNGAGMVGRSPAFNHMVEFINRAAPAMTPVLLLGESGTGKELAAQALHSLSPRRSKPFVPVDCSGMTETLFESELFGYEKGAFTGANQRKIGLVEAAAGGTLFLDEVGDIPLHLQVKLLRLLETSTFRRVGGVETLRADFRLVAATHRGVKQMVEAGTFRRDLYYRISAFPIHLPALRERPDDIPILVESLLARLAPDRSIHLSDQAMARLVAYDFPGNIRELRNLLERALLLADADTLRPEHFPKEMAATMPGYESGALPETLFTVMPLERVEAEYVRWALDQMGGDKRGLAMKLGISERTLYRKLGA
ncbi:MAG: sigma-54-dependent Fis family transcriptional regulator [Parasulfuritortus sp.]|nr:sigma-54-dependent Fis family transcriptional regulator [Parasulfuritortus sp.]